MAYPDGNTATSIHGKVEGRIGNGGGFRLAWTEDEYIRHGCRDVELKGRYRATVSGTRMRGPGGRGPGGRQLRDDGGRQQRRHYFPPLGLPGGQARSRRVRLPGPGRPAPRPSRGRAQAGHGGPIRGGVRAGGQVRARLFWSCSCRARAAKSAASPGSLTSPGQDHVLLPRPGIAALGSGGSSPLAVVPRSAIHLTTAGLSDDGG